jgi:hypothetical protein
MKKIIVSLVAIILLAVFLIIRLNTQGIKAEPKPDNQKEPANEAAAEVALPWIEVESPSAFEIASSTGQALRELSTGDNVIPGSVIKTNEKGFATVHFPDGSVARVDAESLFIINSSEYQKDTQKLFVRIQLIAGKIWSKVMGLATPDSQWEVRTSNAIVTVRGTAFGVTHSNGKSTVIGSENSVKVDLVDPKTNKVIKDNAALVEPKKFVEIDDKAIAALKTEIKVKDVTPAMLQEKWVEHSMQQDEIFNKKLDELKSEGLEGAQLREEFKKDTEKPFIEKIIKKNPPIEQVPNVKPAEPPKIQTSSTTAKQPPSVIDFKMKFDDSISVLTEGDQVQIDVSLVLSDGTTMPGNDKVVWQVIGHVGKFIKPGLFLAELAPDVSELGEVPGALVAEWKDPVTGKTIEHSTPIFKVKARVDDTIDLRG